MKTTKQTIHGVFMDVFGIGVLLMGDSGIGKSEVALSLITRGHRLIADDCVELTYIDDNTIIGECPDITKDFLEVRGLGILNIRSMFGDIAIKSRKALHLVVQLIEITDKELNATDRLQGLHRYFDLFNLKIPEVSIPVAPGRNLAILVEGAVRNEILRTKGYIASDDFSNRQKKLLNDSSIDRQEECN